MLNYRCPHCSQHSIPFWRVSILASLSRGVECKSCGNRSAHPKWLYVWLALITPAWIVWVKVVDPPEHLAMYGLKVALLVLVASVLIAPLTKRSRPAIHPPE